MQSIKVGVSGNTAKKMVHLGDGCYAEVIVTIGPVIHDVTGEFCFNPQALACAATYDGSGNQATITYGPDLDGRSYRQTSNWVGNLWMGDTAWQVVL